MILLLTALSLAAQPAPVFHQHRDLAMSPAGDQIASVELELGAAGVGAPPHGKVVVRSTRDGAVLATLDPCATCGYSGLTWSPRGALAFTATNAATHKIDIDVAEHGQARTVATIGGVAQRPLFSPDGRSLSFLATPGARKQPGAVQAGVPLVGEIGEQNDEQRIAVVPVSGGEVRFISPSDTYVYEYNWTPDSRGFVATSAKGNGDDNWWVAKLTAYPVTGGEGRVIAEPNVQINDPRVSPDGRTVVVIGGLMSDFGPVGGDIYAVPFTGGELKDVTPGFKGSFSSLTWTSHRLLATALIGENAAVVELAAKSFAPTIVWRGQVGLSDAVFSADGAMAASVVQDFEHAPEIVAGKLGEFHPITHDNALMEPTVRATSVSWKSDGYDVQGWLLAPRDPAPGRHPMIVQVHGGPSSAVTPGFISRGLMLDLIDRGYYIFLPNPRGSYGQGETFTHANVKDFGGGDLRDILAGVDAVEKVAPVDDQRLGIMGLSYGGFMTMWAVTHTHRFKAASAGAGVSDWISYYGENGIDQWMLPFFGASAYDDPATYERLSPIFTIKTATTPTFIYVGELDVECPAPQSLEFWHGLKEVGVPTSLIIYPGEGHGIRQPPHVRDLNQRQLDWFKTYLGA